MYLNQVLADIRRESAPPKSLHAEHLFKLNEAVFNLPEEDTVDAKMATKLFQTIEKIRQSYNTGKFDNADSNFFYDYLALLGTMQNQHFFSQKQTEKMLGWIKEVVADSSMGGTIAEASTPSKQLQAENESLRKRLAKYEDLQAAVQVIRNFDLEQAAAAKAKAKAKTKAETSTAKAKSKGSAVEVLEEEPSPPVRQKKGKGKGKAPVAVEDYEEAPAKSKAKGKEKGREKAKDKGKGNEKIRGKNRPAEPPVQEPAARKGRVKTAKGKGKGKENSKESAHEEEVAPPVRATKGKGKGGKGKTKGTSSKADKAEVGAKWKEKAS